MSNFGLYGHVSLFGDLWRLAVKAGIQTCEKRREEQWDERRERRRQRAAPRNLSAATATESADPDCTAAAGAATQPQTKPWRS